MQFAQFCGPARVPGCVRGAGRHRRSGVPRYDILGKTHALVLLRTSICIQEGEKLIHYGILQLCFNLLTQPRTCTFLMVTMSTTVCAAGAFLLDMIGAKAANKASAGAEKMERVSNALDCLAGFLARIPDELELTHRSASRCCRNQATFCHITTLV